MYANSLISSHLAIFCDQNLPTDSADESIKFMSNALAIDLEDYFILFVLTNVVKFENWWHHENRVERNTI